MHKTKGENFLSTKSKKPKEASIDENQVLEESKNTKENIESQEKVDPNKEALEKMEKELASQKDRLLRIAAEYENFRKRTEKEKASIYSDAISMAVGAILPIADSLENATKSLENLDENYKKGLNLIVNQFNESMKKLNVESFGDKGDTFNPDLHNAVAHIEDDNLEENVIAEVFQKGYKIGDRIVRYAMVQVAN